MANIQEQQKKREDLNKELQRMEKLSVEAAHDRRNIEEKITELERTRDEAYVTYTNDKATANTTLTVRRQIDRLEKLKRKWEQDRQRLEEQLLEQINLLERRIGQIADYDRQIDELRGQIQNLDTELSQPQRPVDKGLVKPARGFIMYGPPGTFSPSSLILLA